MGMNTNIYAGDDIKSKIKNLQEGINKLVELKIAVPNELYEEIDALLDGDSRTEITDIIEDVGEDMIERWRIKISDLEALDAEYVYFENCY